MNPKANSQRVDASVWHQPDKRHFVDSINQFGFRLLAQLAKSQPDKNIFISPLSIAAALGMTYNGARTETQLAMAETLGVAELSLDSLNKTFSQLLTSLHALDPATLLWIANSLWLQKGESLRKEFAEQVATAFEASVRAVDFADPAVAEQVNQWVSEKTAGKIDQLVDAGLLRGAILLLLNCVYFKGAWKARFDAAQTEMLPFTQVDGTTTTHPRMKQQGRFRYYGDGEMQVVTLPYTELGLSFTIILPARQTPLADIQASLNQEVWQWTRKQFHLTDVRLGVPRVKLASSFVLNDALAEMGMGIAFGAGADFSGIMDDALSISLVLHKTMLEVNEEGSEAAAATAVIMARSVSADRPPQPIEMIVDRPFFCAICDERSGAILFAGYVLNPGESALPRSR